MRLHWSLVFAVASGCCVQHALAQPAGGGIASRALPQFSQARDANDALMQQYTWNSRTEMLRQGQVKDIRIEQVGYDQFGRVQRSLLNDQPAAGAQPAMPLGFLRRAIAQSDQQFFTGLQGMLDQYTLPTTGKFVNLLSTGVPTGPDANGLYQVTGTDVVQVGDTVTMWMNPFTKHVRRIQANASLQGDAVQVSATFATLPGSGLNYPAFAEATIASKDLSVQVHTYNFVRPGN